MQSDNHKFYIENNEYNVELIRSDYEGALHQLFTFVFRCIEQGSNKNKIIRISVTDVVIDMWTAVGGSKTIKENKDIFAWQLVPRFLPELVSKNNIKVIIHTADNIEKKANVTYFKALPTISETARSIIFSGQKPSNNLIRREILKVCFNGWQDNPHGYLTRSELLKFIPVSEVELERNLDYLSKSYYIDGKLTSGGYALVKITPQGIDLFEDPVAFERRFALKIEQHTYNIEGDMIATNLVGKGNASIVKSDISHEETTD